MALFALWLDLFFPTPNCFRTVIVPTSFASVLSFCRLFPISGAAISNKFAPILFAAGTIHFLTKGTAVLPRVCARVPKPLQRCLACLQKFGK